MTRKRLGLKSAPNTVEAFGMYLRGRTIRRGWFKEIESRWEIAMKQLIPEYVMWRMLISGYDVYGVWEELIGQSVFTSFKLFSLRDRCNLLPSGRVWLVLSLETPLNPS